MAKETVRRDLRVLEDHGLLRRTHGGAYPVGTFLQFGVADYATRVTIDPYRIYGAGAAGARSMHRPNGPW